MAEFKSGYRHYPKDLTKFGYIDPEDRLTHLRLGNDTFIELGRSEGCVMRTLESLLGLSVALFILLCISWVIYNLFHLSSSSSYSEIIVWFLFIFLLFGCLIYPFSKDL